MSEVKNCEHFRKVDYCDCEKCEYRELYRQIRYIVKEGYDSLDVDGTIGGGVYRLMRDYDRKKRGEKMEKNKNED